MTPPARAAVLVLLAAAAGAALLVLRIQIDPSIVFLRDPPGAPWLREARPFELVARPRGAAETTEFRTWFALPGPDPSAAEATELVVRALRSAVVSIDGRVVHDDGGPEVVADWRQPRRVPIPPELSPGEHELAIAVSNSLGPAVVSVGFAGTAPRQRPWLARSAGRSWSEAVPVSALSPPDISRRFPSVAQAVASLWRELAVVLLGAGAVAAVFPRLRRRFETRRWRPRAAWFAALLTVAWVALALHNLFALPLRMGFDFRQHSDYIAYVLRHAAIPLPSEGWQMFQAPLYYVLSALVAVPLLAVTSPNETLRWLRVIPMACGALQVVLCHRAGRAVFPERPELQVTAAAVGGLLPMSLYISQSLGNEPLAGLFSALALVLALEAIAQPRLAARRRRQLALGAILGLGLLSKVTVSLLFGPVLLAVAVALRRSGAPARAIGAALGRISALALLVGGGYYGWVWLRLGRPVFGGSDPAPGIAWTPTRSAGDWWQDPGYRTADQYLSFGESLAHPIYAGYRSVWDGLYSTLWLDGTLSGKVAGELPPWHTESLLAGAWLGLVPLALILLGVARAAGRLSRGAGDGTVLAAATVGLYLAALLWVSLEVPTYSTMKASYTLGLLPCYGVLAAAGFDALPRRAWLRVPVTALLAAWGVFAYLAYFARG
jgi:hypothetical protein